MLMCAEVTAQVAGIVARPIQAAISRLLEYLLSLTVLLGFVVLLPIFNESSSATRCPSRPILFEALLPRRPGRAGLELFDDASVRLRAMAAFGLWWSAVRAFSRGTAFSHDSPRVTGRCLRGHVEIAFQTAPDGLEAER
jgi:hypothetical protein